MSVNDEFGKRMKKYYEEIPKNKIDAALSGYPENRGKSQ